MTLKQFGLIILYSFLMSLNYITGSNEESRKRLNELFIEAIRAYESKKLVVHNQREKSSVAA